MGNIENVNEYAQVSPDGNLWGLINRQGEYVAPPNFKSIGSWHEGVLLLEEKGSNVVAKNGHWVNLYNGKYRFINHNGQSIDDVDCYDYALDFSEGLAAVVKDATWGFISKEGNLSIDYAFQEAFSFQEGLCAVKSNGQWGFITREGNWHINPFFDRVQSFKHGLAVVEKDDACFVINREGEIVLQTPAGFPWVVVKSPNVILYGTTSRDIGIRQYGFVDIRGVIQSAPIFYVDSEFQFDLFDFSQGMLQVTDEEEKYGYVNDSGHLIIPCQYDQAEPFAADGAVVKLSGKKYLINKKGKVIRPWEENSGYPFDEVLGFHEGLAAVRLGNRWGFIDETGALMIDPRYLQYPASRLHLPKGEYFGELKPKFSCGLLPVLRSDGNTSSCGYVDRNRNDVIQYDFYLARSFEKANP